jgi:hypothetical protein
MTSTEQEVRIEMNPLPAEMSDSIRVSFISPSDLIDLCDFFKCSGRGGAKEETDIATCFFSPRGLLDAS